MASDKKKSMIRNIITTYYDGENPDYPDDYTTYIDTVDIDKENARFLLYSDAYDSEYMIKNILDRVIAEGNKKKIMKFEEDYFEHEMSVEVSYGDVGEDEETEPKRYSIYDTITNIMAKDETIADRSKHYKNLKRLFREVGLDEGYFKDKEEDKYKFHEESLEILEEILSNFSKYSEGFYKKSSAINFNRDMDIALKLRDKIVQILYYEIIDGRLTNVDSEKERLLYKEALRVSDNLGIDKSAMIHSILNLAEPKEDDNLRIEDREVLLIYYRRKLQELQTEMATLKEEMSDVNESIHYAVKKRKVNVYIDSIPLLLEYGEKLDFEQKVTQKLEDEKDEFSRTIDSILRVRRYYSINYFAKTFYGRCFLLEQTRGKGSPYYANAQNFKYKKTSAMTDEEKEEFALFFYMLCIKQFEYDKPEKDDTLEKLSVERIVNELEKYKSQARDISFEKTSMFQNPLSKDYIPNVEVSSYNRLLLAIVNQTCKNTNTYRRFFEHVENLSVTGNVYANKIIINDATIEGDVRGNIEKMENVSINGDIYGDVDVMSLGPHSDVLGQLFGDMRKISYSDSAYLDDEYSYPDNAFSYPREPFSSSSEMFSELIDIIQAKRENWSVN